LLLLGALFFFFFCSLVTIFILIIILAGFCSFCDLFLFFIFLDSWVGWPERRCSCCYWLFMATRLWRGRCEMGHVSGAMGWAWALKGTAGELVVGEDREMMLYHLSICMVYDIFPSTFGAILSRGGWGCFFSFFFFPRFPSPV